MAATLKQDEAVPASYPATPTGLSTAAAALSALKTKRTMSRWRMRTSPLPYQLQPAQQPSLIPPPNSTRSGQISLIRCTDWCNDGNSP